MGRKVNYLAVIFVFIGVNVYLCVQLVERFEDFRLKNAPLAIEPLIDNPPGLAGIKDVDKDGNDDIIFVQRDPVTDIGDCWIFSPLKKDAGRNVNGQIERISVPPHSVFNDAYPDEKSKAIVFSFLVYENGYFVLKELSYPGGNLVKEQKLTGLKPGDKESPPAFTKPDFVDLNEDGKVEMLFMLSSYYIHQPRGVVCFDAGSKKLLWKYYCGTLLNEMKIEDLDGDGSKEIILATGGINNGAVMNGTDDAHAYVIVLDWLGKELWKKEIGKWYTHAFSLAVVDLDRDGTLEIITATATHRAHPEVKGQIFVFNALTGAEKKFYPLVQASFSKFFIRYDGTAAARIYVGDGSGFIRMFDRDLNLLETVQENSPIIVLNASTPSKEWDVLLANTRDRLLAFDWELKEKVFEYRFERPSEGNTNFMDPFLIPFHTGQGNEALIYSDRLYRLREIELSALNTGKNMIISGLLPVFIGLILFSVFFIHSARRLSHGFHPLHCSRKIEVGETSRFLDLVREIAQQIKTPVSTISWTAEKIRQTNEGIKEEKSRQDFARLCEFLAEDVKTLKQQTHHLLKLIRIYQPRPGKVALKPCLEHLADRYRALAGENVEIRLEMDGDFSLSIDEEMFKEALTNLVDNAVDAMPEGGKLTLSAVPVTSPLTGGIEQVMLELEDTGCGIEADDLHRIFEPFFSKKQKGSGAGIGLTICQRIIEANGGTIEIYSRKNFGTRVVIIFPAAGDVEKR
jgi:signal transduction histidine kinase